MKAKSNVISMVDFLYKKMNERDEELYPQWLQHADFIAEKKLEEKRKTKPRTKRTVNSCNQEEIPF